MENTLLQWILQNILENQKFQRIVKFMDFMKGIVILVKVDEMYNILKSASNCLLAEFFCWRYALTFVYYVPPVTRDRLHLVGHTAAEKEVDIAI